MKFFQLYYGLNCWLVWGTEFSRMVFFQRRGSIHGGVTTITSWTPKLAPLPSASSSTSFPWSLKSHRCLQKQKSSASSRTHAECYIFILPADQDICKVSLLTGESYVSNKSRSAGWKMYSVLWTWSHCPPSFPISLSRASLNPDGWTETPEKKTSFTRDWIGSQESNTFLPSTVWCSRQFHTMAFNMIYMSSLVYQLNCPLFYFIFWYCWSNKKDGSVTLIKDFNKTGKLPFSTGPCTNVAIALEEKNHFLLLRLSLIVETSRQTKRDKEGIKTIQGT